jgi:hypothetical protein
MATALIDSLRDRVSQRDKLYESVESLATLGPGDAQYDSFLAKHAATPDPPQAVRQEVDVKVSEPLPVLFPDASDAAPRRRLTSSMPPPSRLTTRLTRCARSSRTSLTSTWMPC